MRIIDVSLPLSPRLPTWPGNAPFELQPVKRLASGDPAEVSKAVLGTHSGTHVDAPKHFFAGGAPVDTLPLQWLTGPCTVVEVSLPSGRQPITADVIQQALGGNRPQRLLLKTPNSQLWNTGRFTPDFAYIEPDAAEWIVAAGVKLVGVDYLSVEEFEREGAPTHHVLLGAGIVIVEGLNLAAVAPGAYELICLPLRLEGADGSPARAILLETGVER